MAIKPLTGVEREALTDDEKSYGDSFLASGEKRKALIEAGLNGKILDAGAEASVVVLKEVEAVNKIDSAFFTNINNANPSISYAFFQKSVQFPAQAEATMDVLEHDKELRESLEKAVQEGAFPKDEASMLGVMHSWFSDGANNPRMTPAEIKQQIQASIEHGMGLANLQKDLADLDAQIAEKQAILDQQQGTMAGLQEDLKIHEDADSGIIDTVSDWLDLDEKETALENQIEAAEDQLETTQESFAELQAKKEALQLQLDERLKQEALLAQQRENDGMTKAAIDKPHMAGIFEMLGPEMSQMLMEFLKPLLEGLKGTIQGLADKHPQLQGMADKFDKFMDQGMQSMQNMVEGTADTSNSELEELTRGMDIELTIGDKRYFIDIDLNEGQERVLADFRQELTDDFGPDNNQAIILESSNLQNSPVLQQLQNLNPNLQVIEVSQAGTLSKKPMSELVQDIKNQASQEDVMVKKSPIFDEPDAKMDLTRL